MPLPSPLLRLLSGVLTVITAVSGLSAPPAIAATFSDVPQDHFAREAILFLSDRGTLSGYSDPSSPLGAGSTFKPDKKVNRAEALKVIAAQFIPETKTVTLKSTDFTDIPDNAWYLPAITWALSKRVIDSPPKTTTFHPTRTVTKSEFLKMLFVSHGVDPKAFGDIKLPLSSDATDTGAWYFAHLRYAVATGTTEVSGAGLFGPNRDLTRGDVAVLLHRFILFKSNQRTQALLSLTKQDIEKVITALAKGDVTSAEYASARAILIARGALLTEPDEAVVKVAVKIAEGYRTLTRAYRAGLGGDVTAVLKHSADATTLAQQARKIAPGSTTLADQLEKYAKSFAAQAKK